MSYLPDWIHHEPFEKTPRFFVMRECPHCGYKDTAKPKRSAPPGNPQAIRSACSFCRREGDPASTWREASHRFYGDLAGRAPQFGPRPGQRFRLKTIVPPVYPLPKGFDVGDVVTMIDFEIGWYTVRRDSDGVEGEIAFQNIGELLTSPSLE